MSRGAAIATGPEGKARLTGSESVLERWLAFACS